MPITEYSSLKEIFLLEEALVQVPEEAGGGEGGAPLEAARLHQAGGSISGVCRLESATVLQVQEWVQVQYSLTWADSVPEDDGRETVRDNEEGPGGQGRVSVGVAQGLVVTEEATEKWVTCMCIGILVYWYVLYVLQVL